MKTTLNFFKWLAGLKTTPFFLGWLENNPKFLGWSGVIYKPDLDRMRIDAPVGETGSKVDRVGAQRNRRYRLGVVFEKRGADVLGSNWVRLVPQPDDIPVVDQFSRLEHGLPPGEWRLFRVGGESQFQLLDAHVRWLDEICVRRAGKLDELRRRAFDENRNFAIVRRRLERLKSDVNVLVLSFLKNAVAGRKRPDRVGRVAHELELGHVAGSVVDPDRHVRLRSDAHAPEVDDVLAEFQLGRKRAACNRVANFEKK